MYMPVSSISARKSTHRRKWKENVSPINFKCDTTIYRVVVSHLVNAKHALHRIVLYTFTSPFVCNRMYSNTIVGVACAMFLMYPSSSGLEVK